MKQRLTLKVRAFLSVAIALTLLSSGISAAHAVATAPSDVTVTNASVSGALVTDGWASVKWSATPGSVSYVVEATATGETTITSSPIPFVFGQVNYEYVVEGLSGGVSYGFTVKAVDISNNQATSAATNFLVQSVPDKATAISAVAAPGQITLTWTPPTNTGGLNLGSYSITSVSPAVSTTADSTATEKVITGLTPGASYVFTLVATNSLGNSEGTVFASATVPNVPDAPAKPSATTTGTSIKVDWTDPASNGGSSLTGYKVYLVNTTTSVDAYSKTDLSSSTNTWTFDSVASGSYTAQVVAVNLVNDSARSVASDIQVVAAPVALPSITLSEASETATVGTAITGFTVDSSAGGAVESYAISPDAPAGLTFNTTSGALSGTPTTAQSATTYTVTATNTSGNATDTFELTIAAATQTITFNALANKTYGDAAFTVSATSTSSLTVAFSSATAGVCSVASTTVTILSAGTCTINANQSGNTNYSAAAQVARSFTIAKAAQSALTITSTSATVGSSPLALTTSGGTGTGAVSYVVDSAGTTGCSVSGSNLAYTAAGTCLVTATKESDDNYLVASSISTSIVISAYTPPPPPPPPAPTPTHKVTYALGGGTGTIPTQADVTEGLSFTVAAATGISKTGFTFNQWSDGTKNYAAGATYAIGTADVVLTATWTAIPPAPVLTHKVTYALGGGTGTAPSQVDVAEGASFTLAASTGLTKTGFTFHRWNDGANNYSPGASYTIATADVVLTATWLAAVTPTPTTPTVLVPVVKNSYFTSGVTVVNGSPVVVKGTSGSTVWSKQFPVVAKFTVLPKNTVAKLTITLPTGVIVNLPSGKTNASGAFTVPGMQFAKTGVYTLTIKVGKTTKKLKVTITK